MYFYIEIIRGFMEDLKSKISSVFRKKTPIKKLSLEDRFIEWLTPKGVEFFKNLMDKYGTVFAIWNEGGIPHSVHFREGMQIRNWMRSQPEFKDKLNDDHWFDGNWVEFTERCIRNEIRN